MYHLSSYMACNLVELFTCYWQSNISTQPYLHKLCLTAKFLSGMCLNASLVLDKRGTDNTISLSTSSFVRCVPNRMGPKKGLKSGSYAAAMSEELKEDGITDILAWVVFRKKGYCHCLLVANKYDYSGGTHRIAVSQTWVYSPLTCTFVHHLSWI